MNKQGQIAAETFLLKLRSAAALLSIMLLTGFLLHFDAQLITTQNLSDTLSWLCAHPAASAATAAGLWVLQIFLYGLTGRALPSFLISALPVLLLSVVNYYKTVINGTPFLLSDLNFSKNIGEIVEFALPQLRLTAAIAGSLLLAAAAATALFFLDRKFRMKFFPARAALCGVSAILIAAAFFLPPLLSSVADQQRPLSQEERIEESGVILALYGAYTVSWQETHSRETAMLIAEIRDEVKNMESQAASQSASQAASQAASSLPSSGGEEKPPTVILLMSESFFDLSRLPGIEYPQDITPNFHRLAEECTSGIFYSNTYAGGTGNAEIEVMTGISRSLLRESDTITSLPDEAYAEMPTMASVFRSHGYKNIFLHSHTSDLYNRETIYSEFGFDEILFSDSFPQDAERRGGFISDHAFAQKIISLYEENRDEPLFLSAVSMENHQPYNDDKFAVKTDHGVTSDVLSDGTLNAVQNYAIGLYDADKSLGELVDYFSRQEEPVMLIFFGDHLPNLGSGTSENAYSESGYVSSANSSRWDAEETLKMLSTDYLIWTNYEEEALPDKNTSSTLLCLDILKRLGFPLEGYYAWLDQNVAPEMTLRYAQLFVDEREKVYSRVPEDKYDMLERYSAVIYDIVYGKNEIFG